MSDAFAEPGFAPQRGCSPAPVKGRSELVRGKALELLRDVRGVKDLSGEDEDMHVVRHDFHRPDREAEGVAFVANEPLELMFDTSIQQFLSVLRAPYQMIADVVHAVC